MYLSVHILIFNTSTALTYKERSSSGAQGLWTQRPGFEPSSTPGAGSLGSCTLGPSPQVCLLALGPFLMIRHVGGVACRPNRVCPCAGVVGADVPSGRC